MFYGSHTDSIVEQRKQNLNACNTWQQIYIISMRCKIPWWFSYLERKILENWSQLLIAILSPESVHLMKSSADGSCSIAQSFTIKLGTQRLSDVIDSPSSTIALKLPTRAIEPLSLRILDSSHLAANDEVTITEQRLGLIGQGEVRCFWVLSIFNNSMVTWNCVDKRVGLRLKF